MDLKQCKKLMRMVWQTRFPRQLNTPWFPRWSFHFNRSRTNSAKKRHPRVRGLIKWAFRLLITCLGAQWMQHTRAWIPHNTKFKDKRSDSSLHCTSFVPTGLHVLPWWLSPKTPLSPGKTWQVMQYMSGSPINYNPRLHGKTNWNVTFHTTYILLLCLEIGPYIITVKSSSLKHSH